MHQSELAHLIDSVTLIAHRAGEFILTEQKAFKQGVVELKGHNDLVSYVDRTSEAMIVDGLTKLLPEAGVLGEEGASVASKHGLQWVIDPLDGTTNFVHGMPFFAVSIALCDEQKPILGVVHELGRLETFSAYLGGGAKLNGEPISVSSTKTLKSALLGTGFPYTDFGLIDPYLALFKHLMQHSRGLRRPGSAATDLAYVACGRFDGFFEYGLGPWDVAAGTIIVREAGGLVGDFLGRDDAIFSRQCVASNSFIFEELRANVASFMLSNS